MDSLIAIIYDPEDSWTWTLTKTGASLIWALAACYWIFKVLFAKPWGLMKLHRNMARARQKSRKKQFDTLQVELETEDVAIQDRRQNILSLSFKELQKSLQAEEFSATDTLDAYQWKALQIQQKFNCIVEFITEAGEYAMLLDLKFKGRNDKPALFGLPFSVKENFHIRNYNTCIGLAKRLGYPKHDDNTLLIQLRTLGAVPFVRTNVPQALISFVCSNPTFGTTENPHRIGRTPGGSSGGEACLLVNNCGDLAGSLRIPAAMCGLVTLKMTSTRINVVNVESGCPGSARLAVGHGFFTKTVDEQIELIRSVLTADLFSTSTRTVPLPLNLAEVNADNRLRIGVLLDDNFILPTPGCSRAVYETMQLLRSAGHTVFPVSLILSQWAVELFLKNVLQDGGSYLKDAYKHEDVDPYIRDFLFALKVPGLLKTLLSYLLWNSQLSTILRSRMTSLSDVGATLAATDEYRRLFAVEWADLNLDALLCPAFVTPAVPHQFPSRLGPLSFSVGLYNLLDYPAGIVPVARVSKRDDSLLVDQYPHGKKGNFLHGMIRKAAADSQGLPLAVQIVTQPFREELCLRVMKLVETLVYNREADP